MREIIYSISIFCITFIKVFSQSNYFPLPNGNVGIATTSSPSHALEIGYGNLKLPYPSGGVSGSLYFGGLTYLGGNGLRVFSTTTGSSYFDIKTNTTSDALIFRLDNSLGSTERVRINSQGYMGIGSNNPLAKLDIMGTSPTSSKNILLKLTNGYVNDPTYTVNEPAILFDNGVIGTNNVNWTIGAQVAGMHYFRISRKQYNTEQEFFRINNDGNVGIGTGICIPSGFKLVVNGKVRAREIMVDVDNWCDYVFDTNFHLMPLSHLELYVKQNKHLPDIPSEEDVITNGVELGKMDSLLLKKIEELTLYVIELDKQNKKLQEEVNALKK